ncbi:hypothetical protein DID88_008861 [Monilinia fructigena]|uniref:G-patch domain-containing protein n=1 Tax=Monilinia fructigena TaxID=38457 RepID=A0A395J743_9HELO|nr:hypothetical protein DID88_008861 [Monilinia fructigena]
MNAHALLTSQGWRGTGHSLHHSSDTIGLSRPLLVSKKDNVLGVGKKQHKTSDMWWMNAFDASLKGLDTSKEGQIKVQEGGGLEMVVKGGSKWVGESKEERRARKEKKRADRAKKAAAADAVKIKPEKGVKASTDSEKIETKEERRERKERKRQKKLLRQLEKESSDTSSTSEVTKDKKKKKSWKDK